MKVPQDISSHAPAHADALLPRVYEELRNLARRQLHAENGPATLTATALVHEAYLRMSGESTPLWSSRRHFYNAAAQAMRWILCDRARRKNAQKRGDGVEHVELETQIAAPVQSEDVLALSESLERLEEADPQAAEMIHLRYFAGLTWDEMAELTGVSQRELARQCDYARAWLRSDMTGSGSGK